MERSLLAFTTITLLAPLAQASPILTTDGHARDFDFIAARPSASGITTVRQVLPPRPGASELAQSKVVFLNHEGVILWPGDNDAIAGTSSIVTEPTAIYGWDIDDDTWAETVACVKDMYARFDIEITDEDPGDRPHIEAVVGGDPADVGLPPNVAGVSPFTSDCSIIEGSIVFTFTDVLPDDPQTICEVMSQEIAHSFGLDHELLASDPMTYLDYDGARTFEDEASVCGEYEARDCGINGNMCRHTQNSVQLLTQRLGAKADSTHHDNADGGPHISSGGCSAGGGTSGSAIVFALLGLRRRRAY